MVTMYPSDIPSTLQLPQSPPYNLVMHILNPRPSKLEHPKAVVCQDDKTSGKVAFLLLCFSSQHFVVFFHLPVQSENLPVV